MYFLEISEACGDPALATILSLIRKIFTVIEVVAPIVLLVMVVVHLINMMTNPDDKKGLGKLKNSVFACVIIFFIPSFVNLTMYLIGDSNGFSACWNSNPTSFNDSNYIDTDNSNNSSLFNDPSDYQNGKSNSSSKKKNNTSSIYNVVNNSGTIFIGDSRTVQMYSNISGNLENLNYSDGGVHVFEDDVFIAEGSMGLVWMMNTGIPVAENYFNKDSSIVIMLGINDLGNEEKYLEYINKNSSSWKNDVRSIYFVSVNPCDGTYKHLNSKIKSFNNRMKNGLSSNVKYIDTYSILNKKGFETTDGLHYTASTYKTIYNYIKSKM